jgi:hypothetical protein
LISKGSIFDKELTCLDDATKQECNDVEDDFLSNSNSGTGDGAVFRGGECKEVYNYGKYTCQQGIDAYDTTAITTATTVPNVNTQVKPDTRIFVQLTDAFQNQMYLNGQQSSTTPSKLLKAFQPILNLPPSIIANGNSGANGKSMISYRAGGIEIKFPASLGASDKPELADLRQGVESANKRATGSRQRRAKAPGHKLTYLSMAGAIQLVKTPAEYTQREAYIAAIEMYNTATVATEDIPTAPVPTLPPPPETTKAVVAAVKTLPPTRPRTTSTEAPKTTQPTTQPTIPPKTDGAGQVVLTTVTVTTTTTLPLDRSDAEAVAAFLAEQAAKATKKPAAADAEELDAQSKAATADADELDAAAASAPLYLTLHSLCDPREDKCDPALDLQCDPVAYACRYMSDDDTDKSKVPLSVVVGMGALVLLMLIVGVALKCKSRSPDTNIGNGDEYINPAFHQGNTSPAYEIAPGHDDAAYDFVTGALTMVQGNSGDSDHAALANATYAGMAGVGTEESCGSGAGGAEATYAGLSEC